MLEIIVCIRQIPDPTSLEVDFLTGNVDKERVVYITNPPDLYAIKEALRLREVTGGKVTVLSVGPPRVDNSLKEALAMGADEVLRIWDYDWPDDPEPNLMAFAISYHLKENNFHLILCGDDGSYYQAPEFPVWIAEYLNLPVITGIIQLDLINGTRIKVVRKLERAKRQVMNCSLPAVLAVLNNSKQVEPSLPFHIKSLEQNIRVGNVMLGTLARLATTDELINPIICNIQPFKPEPHLIFTPDCSLTGRERIEQVLSGGLSQRKGTIIRDSPDNIADKIVQLLESYQVIAKKGKRQLSK